MGGRMKRIIGSIAENEPDVVCLQELDMIELFTEKMKTINYTLVGYQQKRGRNPKCHSTLIQNRQVLGKQYDGADLDGVGIFVKNGMFRVEVESRPRSDCASGYNDGKCARKETDCDVCKAVGHDEFWNTCAKCKGTKKWSVCEDTQRTDDGKCNGCDSDWGEIKPCKVCLDMPYGTPDWRTTHRMPPADPVNFDGSYYLGNAGKGFGLPLDKNDPTTPAPNKKWKQIMTSAHLQMVKTRQGEDMLEPVDIDIFSFHGKSGDRAKDTPIKKMQAKFCANEIAKVKKLRPNTHVFFPCDFNTHISNTVPEGKEKDDTYTQFLAHLMLQGRVNMESAYKDVLGEHPQFTCVKTREWTDYRGGTPNQGNKIGTTSNGIDYVGHCNNSMTLAVSNLLAANIDPEDYWRCFPSEYAFSDHGVPLVADFALSEPKTLEIKSTLEKMSNVKNAAQKMDVKIRTRVIVREFAKSLEITEIMSATKSLPDFTKAVKAYVKKTKTFKGPPSFVLKIETALAGLGGGDLGDYLQTLQQTNRKCNISALQGDKIAQFMAAAGGEVKFEELLEAAKAKAQKDGLAKAKKDAEKAENEANKTRSVALKEAGENIHRLEGQLAFAHRTLESLTEEAREAAEEAREAAREAASEDAFLNAGVQELAELLQDSSAPKNRRRLTAEQVLHHRRLAYGARTSTVLAALMEEIAEAECA